MGANSAMLVATTQWTNSSEFATARMLFAERGNDCVTVDLIAKVFPVSNRFRQPGGLALCSFVTDFIEVRSLRP